jgi:hypothetical protein
LVARGTAVGVLAGLGCAREIVAFLVGTVRTGAPIVGAANGVSLGRAVGSAIGDSTGIGSAASVVCVIGATGEASSVLADEQAVSDSSSTAETMAVRIMCSPV